MDVNFTMRAFNEEKGKTFSIGKISFSNRNRIIVFKVVIAILKFII